MKIENRTVVSIGYTLYVNDNGKEVIADKADSGKPLTFLFGLGQLLPEFEKNLEGKTIGDKYDFLIKAENGYGLSDDRNLVHIPISAFYDELGKIDENIIKVGEIIPMKDNEGNTFQGIVKEVTTENVLMDFNHPLADKDLHFVGEIFNVRIATLEELQHGHVHGEGGHHH
jgi:FKBP-type peptidyl-prolyl cis-trans isomerase SlyD